jgi:hypothetical protein
MKQTLLKNLRVFLILSLFAAAIARSDDGREAQPRKTSVPSFQKDDQIRTEGSRNEPTFQSRMPGYWLVTDVWDGWGGESKSTGYGITVSSGGQAAGIGISESNNYKANTGFIPAVQVKRGDVNQTGMIDIGDVVFLINYLYRAGSRPIPLESGDCNCDGGSDVGDVVYLINYLFKNGLPPCG